MGSGKTQRRRREATASGLHSAAIHLLRRIRAADRASGLSPQRLSALSVVVFAGPIPMGALAEAEQVTPATISRLVKGLERDGLIRRRSDPDDDRVHLVEATPAGRKILEQGRARRIEALAELLEGLSGSQLSLLDRAARLMEGLSGRGRPS